jgi:large subunit ribosomal protein L22
MGKQAKPRVLADSEAKSVLRNLRISPQKHKVTKKKP